MISFPGDQLLLLLLLLLMLLLLLLMVMMSDRLRISSGGWPQKTDAFVTMQFDAIVQLLASKVADPRA